MKSWKDMIIEDQKMTIERLALELEERVNYERKLIEMIKQLQGE